MPKSRQRKDHKKKSQARTRRIQIEQRKYQKEMMEQELSAEFKEFYDKCDVKDVTPLSQLNMATDEEKQTANLIIEEAEVVSKSYPTFWNDLKKVGFEITKVN